MSTDNLLQTIYSTALDSDGWQAVCDEISTQANATGAVLICSRPEMRPFGLCCSESLGPLMGDYLREGWYRDDVRARGAQSGEGARGFFKEGYVLDRHVVGPDQIRHEPFYSDLLQRHGFRWFCGLRIGDEADWACLSINRQLDDEHFEPSEVARLLQCAQHVTRAAKLAEVANFARLEGALEAFETTATPAIAVDTLGVVRTHNAATEVILGSGLSIIRGRLVCDFHEDQTHLDRMINRLGNIEIDTELPDYVIVRRNGTGPDYVVRGCPLLGAPLDLFSGRTSILFVETMEGSVASIANLLRDYFGLTPAEGRLASHLADGMGLKDCADRLMIAESTIRDRMKAILAKTDTHRQAELVVLLNRLARLARPN